MSYNGSGTFSINTAGQPVVTGTVITSTAFNALTADLANGLSTALCKDGQSTPTANIGLGNFKITSLGNGTAATDAVNLSQVQSSAASYLNVSGADTIIATASPALTAYATGNVFYFAAAGTNTGAVTLNIDGLGAKAITRDGSTALVAGDLVANSEVVVVYDGTRFQVLNSNSKTNFNLSGTLTAASTATATKFIPTGGTATGNGMYLPTTNTLAWSTNSSERMRLDSSGNLGLGMTPSAWAGGRLAIQLAGNAFLQGRTGGTLQTVLGNNYYHDGTGFKYVSTGTASGIDLSGGGCAWYTAASGSAGAAVSLTQSMTLDVSGNLGIGMTPSAWVGSWKAVQGQGSGGVFAVASGGNGMYVMGNSYYNASGLPVYTSSSYATMYQQTSGTHVFYTAASGTAGNTITFTENGRFTAGGYFKTSNTGTYLNSTGTYSEFYQTANDVSLLVTAAASSLTQGCNGVQIYYPNATPNSTTATYLYCSDASALRASIRSNGGIANYQANDTNLSDRREKTDFSPAKRYLDVVCAIPVQTFKYIDQTDDEPTLGVVAQDVQAVAPELVSESNWGTIDKPKMRLSVYQTDLQYALMKAIQDLTAEVQVLRDRVAQLETK